MPLSRFASEMEGTIHSGLLSTSTAANAPLIASSRIGANEGDGVYRSHYTAAMEAAAGEAAGLRFSDWIVDEAWSCAAIAFTFWFFVCMIMIMGVYGSVTLILGPHSSILIKPNSYFVNYVKVEDLYEGTTGPIVLYGLHKQPPLDVVVNWSEVHSVNLKSSAHKEWTYFLNKGSQINISYSVDSASSSSSSSLILLIAKGYGGLHQWLDDPFHPNTSLSWRLIQGNGTIHQDISASSSYYVALGNFNREASGVQLKIWLRTLAYDATEAYDKCSFIRGECTVQIPFGGRNAALLTSPGPIHGREMSEWYVKLSYGPRWITYIGGIGGMILLLLTAIYFSCYFVCLNGARRLHIHDVEGGDRTEEAPHVQNKDDDVLSRGSSYDSVSQCDDDLQDLEEKSAKDSGENNSSTRRLCAICFDAPRNCFFLPCGHCMACFTCGTRIAKASGTCPICRRHMKKVKKIFTV